MAASSRLVEFVKVLQAAAGLALLAAFGNFAGDVMEALPRHEHAVQLMLHEWA
jgi:hypothetical protein